ncbi:MAG: fumarylacetoacetate hydrolase family protein [Qipengyuania sp.]|nr:fumarylacetoacetate hydrolase family protein [Qipengyuania sp.]
MERSAIEQAARELRDAYQSQPVEPIRERLLENLPELGYEVQEINTRFWEAQGRKIVGRKIGLTSQAVQSQLGVHEPDYGILFEDMGVPDRGSFSVASVHQPRAEGELAFGLKAALGNPDATEAEVEAAIEWMAPAIEIVGSRVRDWQIQLVDTIADNASSGMFVVGSDHRPFDRAAADGLSMELLEDERMVSSGLASACLGSPVTALTWLARKMAVVGRPLAIGDLVLSGAFGPLAPIAAGHRYTLRMKGFADLWIDCTD